MKIKYIIDKDGYCGLDCPHGMNVKIFSNACCECRNHVRHDDKSVDCNHEVENAKA